MMDIKEIIKWFIPCFHILQGSKVKMDSKLTFVFIILLFNLCAPCFGSRFSDNRNVSSMIAKHSSLVRFKRSDSEVSQSDSFNSSGSSMISEWIPRSWSALGRPFIRKAVAGLIPLAFQMGAASTWAVIAALVGFKTLLVAGAILKVLLLAGAAKFGAYFNNKHQSPPEPTWDPQKQIHLHIHNGHHGTHDEHLSASPWSRIGDQHLDLPGPSASPQNVNVLQALQAYSSLTTTTQPSWIQALQSYISATTTTPSPFNVLQALQAYVGTSTTTPSPLNVLQALQAYVGTSTTTPSPLNMLQVLASQPNFLQALQQSYSPQHSLPVQNLVIPSVQNGGPQTISTPFGTYLKIDKGPAMAAK